MGATALLRRSRRDDGAAAVEFALISVILVTLLTGVVQFGFTFWEYIQVAHSAREGVRWAALGAPGQAADRAKAASPGLTPSKMNVSVQEISSQYAVRVTVTYPRTVIVPMPGLPLPATITSVAEQRVE